TALVKGWGAFCGRWWPTPVSSLRLAQGPERGPDLAGEGLRVFPGGGVAAQIGLVEVGEVGVDRLDPAPGRRPDLAGEGGEADRYLDRRRRVGAGKRWGRGVG